jgi:hypothetical protein
VFILTDSIYLFSLQVSMSVKLINKNCESVTSNNVLELHVSSEYLFFLFSRFLRILGNINNIKEIDIFNKAIEYYTLICSRFVLQGLSMPTVVIPPSKEIVFDLSSNESKKSVGAVDKESSKVICLFIDGNSVLDIFGAWLVEACISEREVSRYCLL